MPINYPVISVCLFPLKWHLSQNKLNHDFSGVQVDSAIPDEPSSDSYSKKSTELVEK